MRAEDALHAAQADAVAEKVQAALVSIEQAGRGIGKVFSQLSTGVPVGNEVYYLNAVQGYINVAMEALIEANTPMAAPESQAPKLVI